MNNGNSGVEQVLNSLSARHFFKCGNKLVHNHPGHIPCLTPGVKAVKSFYGVLPSLVMVYHKTNSCGRSFSISEDTVKKIVALTLKIAKEYFHMIL